MINKKILCFVTQPNDAISWWRSTLPFQVLRTQFPGWVNYEFVNAKRTERTDWSVLGNYDAVFLHRLYNQKGLEIAQYAKDMGLPIWYENDDNLFCVPPSNPAFRTFNDPQVKNTAAEIAKLADIISVTTPHLKQAYDFYCKDVRVIPNALPDFYWHMETPPKKSEKLMVWRGSRTHDEDMETVIRALCKIATKKPDWKHLWIGDPPWKCQELMPHKAIKEGIRDLPKYFRFMRQLSGDIGYVPLANNPFNHSKSNIAWLEFSMMGAAVIAPKFPEWERPGITNYNTEVEFYERLTFLADNADLRAQLVQQSRAYIEENLLLRRVNQLRLQLLGDLCGVQG